MLPANPVWIAETAVVFLHGDGRRNAGRIAVGMPVRNENGIMLCPIALDGLQNPIAIAGEDSLQALMLAVRFLGASLHSFVSSAGRVLDPEGNEDFQVGAYFGDLVPGSDRPMA